MNNETDENNNEPVEETEELMTWESEAEFSKEYIEFIKDVIFLPNFEYLSNEYGKVKDLDDYKLIANSCLDYSNNVKPALIEIMSIY